MFYKEPPETCQNSEVLDEPTASRLQVSEEVTCLRYVGFHLYVHWRNVVILHQIHLQLNNNRKHVNVCKHTSQSINQSINQSISIKDQC